MVTGIGRVMASRACTRNDTRIQIVIQALDIPELYIFGIEQGLATSDCSAGIFTIGRML